MDNVDNDDRKRQWLLQEIAEMQQVAMMKGFKILECSEDCAAEATPLRAPDADAAAALPAPAPATARRIDSTTKDEQRFEEMPTDDLQSIYRKLRERMERAHNQECALLSSVGSLGEFDRDSDSDPRGRGGRDCPLIQRVRTAPTKLETSTHTHIIEIDQTTDLSNIAHTVQSPSHQSLKSVYSSICLRGSMEGEPADWTCPAAQDAFVQAIAAVAPRLECLSVLNFGMVSDSNETAFPIRLVTKLVQQQPTQHRHHGTLTRIHLSHMSLMGTQTELEELASSLLQHQYGLKHFSMSYCGFSCVSTTTTNMNGDGCTGMVLDPIVRALAKLPSLQTVELWSYSQGMMGDLHSESLERLFRSQSLTTIHLEGFIFQSPQIQAIAASLETNSTLKKLDLHLLKQASPMALAESLRHNTQLQSLELFCANSSSTTTAKSINDDDSFLRILANDVLTNHNRSLQTFKIHCYQSITPLEEEAFANMLETNNALQVLDLNGYQGDFRPKIDSLLQWNRRGRRPQYHPDTMKSSMRSTPLGASSVNGNVSQTHHPHPSNETSRMATGKRRHHGKKKKRSQVDIADFDIASDLVVHTKEL